MRRVTPAGYLALDDAVRRLAGIEPLTEADLEVYDALDQQWDREALIEATDHLRRVLVNGVLTGVHQTRDGELAEVPTWTWSDDAKCLERTAKMLGEKNELFHSEGILVEGMRYDVFIDEAAFEGWRKKGASATPPKSARPKRPQGRPPGELYDDSKWVEMIHELVESGMSVNAAATKVARENWCQIEKLRSGVDEDSIVRRLRERYKASFG